MNPRTEELLNRTFKFGVDMLQFLNLLPYNPIYKVAIIQVARYSTSIGANYEEAQGASSRKDFRYRISISHREARETVYWLRILRELYKQEGYIDQIKLLCEEATSLKLIFASIRVSVKL